MRILLLIFSILSFGLFGCEMDNINKSENKTYSYLALGDSYTIGTGEVESARYPVQLVDSLEKFGYNIDNFKIIAKNGWATDELYSAVLDSNIDRSFDLVSLLIGVNDQYRGRDTSFFHTQFTKMLNKALEFANNDINRIFLISIPDWGVTPFALERNRDPNKIKNEIDAYNEIVRTEAENRGISYFNITDISRRAANDLTLLADDKLHPSGKMYSLWIERILPDILKKLDN